MGLLTGAASLLLLLLGVTTSVEGLDNGLARTPPMGWNSWVRFRCNIECDNDPHNCISEKLYMEMADVIASQGYKDVGYEYVDLDDCWMAEERDDQGRLQADPKRFPSGIKALADYIHSKGLKMGIYQSMGLFTCDQYPGIWSKIDIDAKTYAEWGIDLVKMDTCWILGDTLMTEGFKNMSRALVNSGRPILFSCEWPRVESKPNFTEIAQYCNTFRDTGDVQDSWGRVTQIVDWFAARQEILYNATGPGCYNDADFIVAGDFALSTTEAQSQFAIWAILASQLLLSSDLRNMDPAAKAIVQNKEVIAINQDKLGKMGQRIYKKSTFEIWKKELADNAYSVVFFSRSDVMPVNYTTTLKDLGITGNQTYLVRDLFSKKDIGIFKPLSPLSVMVNPSGVNMTKITPLPVPPMKTSFKPVKSTKIHH